MMYLISKIIGIVALLIMIVVLFPLLGWLNWIVIPIAVIGLLFGAFRKTVEVSTSMVLC